MPTPPNETTIVEVPSPKTEKKKKIGEKFDKMFESNVAVSKKVDQILEKMDQISDKVKNLEKAIIPDSKEEADKGKALAMIENTFEKPNNSNRQVETRFLASQIDYSALKREIFSDFEDDENDENKPLGFKKAKVRVGLSKRRLYKDDRK